MAAGMKVVTDAFSLYDHNVKELVAEMDEALGDISGFEVWGAEVLLGVYCRESITSGGIIIEGSTSKEDVWQGKVARILAIGPDAFTENAKTFNGRKPAIGDWIFHNVNDVTIQHFFKGPGSKMRNHVAKDGKGNVMHTQKAREWDGWPIRLVSASRINGRVARPETIL